MDAQRDHFNGFWGCDCAYAFVGGGLGHGVGLSQTGAYGLARLGWSSDRILSFYYPGTQIQLLQPQLHFDPSF